MRLILLWCCNALALIAVAYLLRPGVLVDGFFSALLAALVLGLINTLVRPLLLLLMLPDTMLTLGLFIFMLNGLLFWFAGSVLSGFRVSGFWWAVLGAFLYSVISSLLALLIPPHQPPRRPPGNGSITVDHDTL